MTTPSSEHDKKKEFTIIVNARPKEWSEKEISFEQVAHLAFPDDTPDPARLYTVTYKKGDEPHSEGHLVAGERVHVKSGMVFNVTATNRS